MKKLPFICVNWPFSASLKSLSAKGLRSSFGSFSLCERREIKM